MASVHRHFGLGVALIAGIVLGIVLCVQCVRTYFYVARVLVPEEAKREADRQAGNLASAVRSASVTDVSKLSSVLQRVIETDAQRVLWMRLLDSENVIQAQAGSPVGTPEVPQRWWQLAEKHEDMRRYIDTPEGKAWVVLLPFPVYRVLRAKKPKMPHPAMHEAVEVLLCKAVATEPTCWKWQCVSLLSQGIFTNSAKTLSSACARPSRCSRP